MTRKNLLLLIRCLCAGQFAVVLFFVVQGGVSRTDMIYVLLSAAFGLVCDGFSQTVLKAEMIKHEKAELDMELDHLMEDFNKEIQDKHSS